MVGTIFTVFGGYTLRCFSINVGLPLSGTSTKMEVSLDFSGLALKCDGFVALVSSFPLEGKVGVSAFPILVTPFEISIPETISVFSVSSSVGHLYVPFTP